MVIKNRTIFSCDGCVYVANTQDGRPACILYNRLIDLDNDFCSLRIDTNQDPICEKCHNHTYGRGVVEDSHIYCEKCGRYV